MNEFNWRRVNNVFEIFKILLSFKDDFYLKKMNDEKILLEFATKLSKYAF